MKIIRFIVLFIVFVILFVFAYANVQISEFNVPFYATYEAPLIWFLFVSFLVGIVLGMLSMLTRILNLRQKVNALKRDLKAAEGKYQGDSAPAASIPSQSKKASRKPQ